MRCRGTAPSHQAFTFQLRHGGRYRSVCRNDAACKERAERREAELAERRRLGYPQTEAGERIPAKEYRDHGAS